MPVARSTHSVVRELLFNAHKHARAQRVVVTQDDPGAQPRIAVQDDGVGFERPRGPWHFSAEGGYGLHSAEAQMGAVGGRLAVSSRLGQGTCAQLWLLATLAQVGRGTGSTQRPALGA